MNKLDNYHSSHVTGLGGRREIVRRLATQLSAWAFIVDRAERNSTPFWHVEARPVSTMRDIYRDLHLGAAVSAD